MRYRPIPPELFTSNRKRLSSLLPPKAIAIINANDIPPTNADGTSRFRQNSDLFYLSGVDQEESILLLFPEASDPKQREILFLRQPNEHLKVWEGAKLERDQATALSGVAQIHWLSEFDGMLRRLMMEAGPVFLNLNEHPRAATQVESRDLRFIRSCQHEYPLHDYRRLAPLLHQLRLVKQPAEIELLQQACDITRLGFLRTLSFVRPGVFEFEVEAELAHEYLRHRASGFAYEPIIATGNNACTLHYVENHDRCEDGQLLLMDAAAQYANYNADLTRTIPVNGRFTPRQRAVYDAVLTVMRQASELLRPGTLLADYQEQVGSIMEQQLVDLGLIDPADLASQDPEKPLYKKYFMHGTSHHLGLDVHDVGGTYFPVAPGMVFTVEPGIYLPDEGFAVRLENNILIGEHGNTDLMAHIPIEAEEIEQLMADTR